MCRTQRMIANDSARLMFSDSAVRSLGWIRSTPRRIWDGKTCRTWWTGHASSLRWALSHPSAFETFRDITSMGDRPKIGLKSTDMKAESWQAFQKQLVNALVRHIPLSRYVALLRTKSAWIDRCIQIQTALVPQNPKAAPPQLLWLGRLAPDSQEFEWPTARQSWWVFVPHRPPNAGNQRTCSHSHKGETLRSVPAKDCPKCPKHTKDSCAYF